MNVFIQFLVAGWAALLGMFPLGIAGAAELKVLSALSIKGIMDELAPEFQRASGHKLTIGYDALGVVMKRIDGKPPTS